MTDNRFHLLLTQCLEALAFKTFNLLPCAFALYLLPFNILHPASSIKYPAFRLGISDCGLRIGKNSTVNYPNHLVSINNQLNQPNQLNKLFIQQPATITHRPYTLYLTHLLFRRAPCAVCRKPIRYIQHRDQNGHVFQYFFARIHIPNIPRGSKSMIKTRIRPNIINWMLDTPVMVK